MSSRNITIESVTVQNSPNWHIHPVNSKDILLSNVRILAPRFTANTDGFDPDSCENVVVRDTFIDTGDDGISIKSGYAPSRNIHIYTPPFFQEASALALGFLVAYTMCWWKTAVLVTISDPPPGP
jgi:polygalacturonase